VCDNTRIINVVVIKNKYPIKIIFKIYIHIFVVYWFGCYLSAGGERGAIILMPWPKRKRAFLRLKRRGGSACAWTVLVALTVNILLSAQLSYVYAGSVDALEASSFERDILVLCSMSGAPFSASADKMGFPDQEERRNTRTFCVFCLPFSSLVVPREAPAAVLSEGIAQGMRLTFPTNAQRSPISLAVSPLGSRAPPKFS